MLRTVGLCVIVISGVGCGFAMSNELGRRKKMMEMILRMIILLRGEIRYGNKSLYDAFTGASGKLEGKYREFFILTAQKMKENMEKDAGCVIDIEEAEKTASEDVVAQREEALAKQLSEMKRRKKRLVDPLQFEMSIQAEDLSGYVPAFGWEMAPPSDGQKKTLEKLGILPDAIENAGKASKILDRLDKRRREGLTTPKQIRFLESRGFQHVGTWQFETAKNMIDRIAGNGWRVPSGIIPAEYRG